MTLVWKYRNDDGDIVELVNGVQVMYARDEPGTDGLVVNAEEGSVGRSRIVVDDPTSSFRIRGHRKIFAVETEAIADIHKGVIYVAYSSFREIVEGSPFDGIGRSVSIDLDDLNTVFDRRHLEGADAKRPAETDVQRAQWLYATNEMSLVDSDEYLSTEDPVQLDAADLRGQKVSQVWDDMAVQSGKNWYLIQKDLGHASDPTSGYVLWYGHGTLEEWISDVRISNVPDDIDGDETGFTFAPAAAPDTKWKRDPSRVVSGVRVNYDGGSTYVRRGQTAIDFAIGGRDATISAPNVKTKKAAAARGNRYLRDNATEEDSIMTSIVVPASMVNALTWGHYVRIKLSWLADLGYGTDFVWMRVVNRTVRQVGNDVYEIAVELVAPAPALPAVAVGAVFYLAKGPAGNAVWWGQPGDTPPPGHPGIPTSELLEVQQDTGGPFGEGWSYMGWKVLAPGTLNLHLIMDTVGVLIDHIPYTVTWGVAVNGSLVESDSLTVSGFLQFYSRDNNLTVTGLEVAADDIVSVYLSCDPPTMPFFMTPGGTGFGTQLRTTGGSLA
jgi:hypothetical protein